MVCAEPKAQVSAAAHSKASCNQLCIYHVELKEYGALDKVDLHN
jgi:hypothetical protein